MNYPNFREEMRLELISYFQPSQINMLIGSTVSWVLVDLSIGRLSLLLSNATPGKFSIFIGTMPDDVKHVICHIVNKAFNDALRKIHNNEYA